MANGRSNSKYRHNGAAHAAQNGTRDGKPMALDPASTGQLAVNSDSSDESSKSVNKLAEPAEPAKSASEGESLNKIRDILFGQQVQSQAVRFEKLERRVSEDYEHLKADFIARMEALETRLTDHLERLDRRLRSEETAREGAIAGVAEKLSDVNQDIRADIKHQTLTLKDALEQQVYDVLADLNQEKQARVQSTKAERAQLSRLFKEISLQLTDELADDT